MDQQERNVAIVQLYEVLERRIDRAFVIGIWAFIIGVAVGITLLWHI